MATNKNFESIRASLYGDIIDVDKKNSTITIFDDPETTQFKESDETTFVVYVEDEQMLEEIYDGISEDKDFFCAYHYFIIEGKQNVDGELEDCRLISVEYFI